MKTAEIASDDIVLSTTTRDMINDMISRYEKRCEYRSDEKDKNIISKFLCSLSNEEREDTMLFVSDVNDISEEIMNRTGIELSEFEIIVRMCAVQKGVVDDDMKTNTQEMMKMKTHYEVEFTRHNMITQEHRISYMLNESFRVPAVPTTTPTYSCPCGNFFKSAHGKNHYNHINSSLHKAWVAREAAASAVAPN